MPLQKVGINFTNWQNITPPSFNFKNTSQGLIDDIPIKANEVSQGFFGFISLSILFTFLMWKLHQALADGGDYGYNKARSIGVASCICSVVGLYAVNIGYFSSYYHVVIFIVMSFISAGIVWKSQN